MPEEETNNELSEEEILEKVEHLPTYAWHAGEKPQENQIWEQDINNVHIRLTNGITASHSGTTNTHLEVRSESEEGREQVIQQFTKALEEPYRRKVDEKFSDTEYLDWLNVDYVIERKKREKRQ
ncbi:MAG: hypothetical protein V1808_04420 [Candidatus Daviesbacteria bacterium]